MDSLIENNLKLIFNFYPLSFFISSLKDENNNNCNKTNGERIAKILEDEGLIDLVGERCDLKKKGIEISEKGGWNNYRKEQINKQLQKEKLEQRKEIAEIESLEWGAKLSKWQVKTKLLPYGFSLLSLVFSIFAFFNKGCNIDTENVSYDKTIFTDSAIIQSKPMEKDSIKIDSIDNFLN